jgi:hypothetical protein
MFKRSKMKTRKTTESLTLPRNKQVKYANYWYGPEISVLTFNFASETSERRDVATLGASIFEPRIDRQAGLPLRCKSKHFLDSNFAQSTIGIDESQNLTSSSATHEGVCMKPDRRNVGAPDSAERKQAVTSVMRFFTFIFTAH